MTDLDLTGRAPGGGDLVTDPPTQILVIIAISVASGILIYTWPEKPPTKDGE